MTARIVLLGASGQVGHAFQRVATPGAEVFAPPRAAVDLRFPERSADAVAALAPDVVVNLAANTNVEAVEEDAATAMRVNAEAPGAIALVCARRGARLVHVSSDAVFDGSGVGAIGEDAPCNPLNVYGRSKRAGELAIFATGVRAFIVRTSSVFSDRGRNLVTKTLDRASRGAALRYVGDRRFGPTPAPDLARVLARLALDATGEPGVYHFCGAPDVSPCEFALEIRRFSEAAHWPDIIRVTSSEFDEPIRRPRNTVLDCTKIYEAFRIRQPDWRPALHSVVRKLEERRFNDA